METIGLLLMAYGGPDSLDDIEPYLLDIRGGRPTSPELVEEIRQRYAAIGGRSPLLEITRRQAQALAHTLNARYAGRLRFQPFVGMRHWTPRIHQAVEEMQAAGVQRAVGFVMAPHYSKMSTGRYMQILEEALDGQKASLQVQVIPSWHTHPGFIDALAERVRQRLPAFNGKRPHVLFTAHSLPARILKEGDPYASQLLETAPLAAAALALPPSGWEFCFQSAGRSPEPWLGPAIENVLPRLAAEQELDVLVAPVGFVADHVEVLYDIDIEAAQIARSLGMHLERSPSLNDSPTLINALADMVAAGFITAEPAAGAIDA